MIRRPPPTTKLIDGPSAKRPRLLVGNPATLRTGIGASPQLPKPPKNTAVYAGWLVLAVGYILAAIPFLGFAILMIGIFLCGAAGLLGVIGAAKGNPVSGVILILAAIGSFFAYMLMPFVVIAIGAALS